MSLQQRINREAIRTTVGYALDQRRLRVAPRVPDVDDERNPGVVDGNLRTHTV